MQVVVSGVEHALKTIERYTDIQSKLMEIAYRLCEIGSTVCDSVYHTSVSVYVKKTDKGAMVVCEGEDVLFIEFGTGDAAGRTAGLYDAVPDVVRPGSWSETHAQLYSRYGFWFFPPGSDRRITETAPHPATYEAYKEMVQAIPRVAKEVFGY